MDSKNEGFPIGAILLDRYRIERALDAGAMSHVYFSKDQWQTDSYAIVKTPIAKLLHDKWILRKFKQEAESLVRLDHPHIVKLLGHGEYDLLYPFVILEYVEGTTLTKLMKELSADTSRAAKLFLQITEAVEHAHSRQIFHRDLKPDNIMVRRPNETDEAVKIIDFGIARIEDSFFATGVGTRYQVGTPFYLSPNRLNHEPDDLADDVYALGLIAYEMVTGSNPLTKARNMTELRDIQEKMVPPHRINPSLPKEVSLEIFKALSLSPINRQTSALEFGRGFHAPFFKREEKLPVLISEQRINAETHDAPPITQPPVPPDEIVPNELIDETIPSEDYFNEQAISEAELLAAVSPGERFLLIGDFESAIAFYDEKIALNAKSDAVYARRAMAYLMKKDYEKASLDCQSAIKINLNSDFAYLIRGILYRLKLWTAEAETELLKAIHYNQNNIEAALILGDIHASRGETEQALSYYAHICRVNPRFSWVYTSRGNFYYNKSDFDAAINDFTLAIKYNPELDWNFYRRAKAFTKKSANEQAVNDLTSAIALDPKNTTYYNDRAKLLFKLGSHSDALADFNRIKELTVRDSFIAADRSAGNTDKKSGLASLTDYLKWILSQ